MNAVDSYLGWELASICVCRRCRRLSLSSPSSIRLRSDQWRAQLWMARHALKHRDPAGALNLYQQSLAAAPSPAPHDLLLQMSGDLGNAGHLAEILNLVLPRFFSAVRRGNMPTEPSMRAWLNRPAITL